MQELQHQPTDLPLPAQTVASGRNRLSRRSCGELLLFPLDWARFLNEERKRTASISGRVQRARSAQSIPKWPPRKFSNQSSNRTTKYPLRWGTRTCLRLIQICVGLQWSIERRQNAALHELRSLQQQLLEHLIETLVLESFKSSRKEGNEVVSKFDVIFTRHRSLGTLTTQTASYSMKKNWLWNKRVNRSGVRLLHLERGHSGTSLFKSQRSLNKMVTVFPPARQAPILQLTNFDLTGKVPPTGNPSERY